MKTDKYIRAAFLNGMENLRAVGKKKQLSLLNSARILGFYVYLSLLGFHSNSADLYKRNVFFVNGPLEERRSKNVRTEDKIFVRAFSRKKQELRGQITLPSLIPMVERIYLLLYSIITVPRGGNYLGRWFEYQLLVRVIMKYSFESISSYGHYDEFTYWLSALSRLKGTKYNMYQHGVVTKMTIIPHKVHCDELHVFDKYSKAIFMENIINNKKCRVFMEHYEPFVGFKKLAKKRGIKYIGVVDQNNTEWTREVVSEICKANNSVAVIMPHPLRDAKDYIVNNYEKSRVMINRAKFYNLDCLIFDNSTLFFDYLSFGFKGVFACTSKEAWEGQYKDFDVKFIPVHSIMNYLDNVQFAGC